MVLRAFTNWGAWILIKKTKWTQNKRTMSHSAHDTSIFNFDPNKFLYWVWTWGFIYTFLIPLLILTSIKTWNPKVFFVPVTPQKDLFFLHTSCRYVSSDCSLPPAPPPHATVSQHFSKILENWIIIEPPPRTYFWDLKNRSKNMEINSEIKIKVKGLPLEINSEIKVKRFARGN